MMAVFVSLLPAVRSSVRSRAALQIEVLALRHQLRVLERRHPHRLRLKRAHPIQLTVRKSSFQHGKHAGDRCLRTSVDEVGSELVTIVHKPAGTTGLAH